MIWTSIPIANNYRQWYSTLDNSITAASFALSMATNAVTTLMVACKLWYVAVGGIHWIQWLTVM